MQGRGVDPSLNETGRNQAQLFYDAYKTEGFEIVYTSSLRRTHESVIHFIEAGIPWLQSADIDEISWGIFEGKRATPEFKKLYRELLECWTSGHLNEKAPGGESPAEVQQRHMKFISYLFQQTEKKILICMHGRAMRIFLPTLLHQTLNTMDQFPHHNLTLYKLIYEDKRFSIQLFNNMDHLQSMIKEKK